MKNLTALLLIIASIVIFFLLIKPTYGEIQQLRQASGQYDEALSKINTLADTLDKHKATLETFDPADIDRINKVLPDHADNVQLIIDINSIASDFGLIIKKPIIKDPRVEGGQEDVEGEVAENNSPFVDQSEDSGPVISEAPYNSIDLSFTVTSSYGNFVKFIESLEKSLRLVDIIGVTFIAPVEGGDVFDFRVTIRTYWLN